MSSEERSPDTGETFDEMIARGEAKREADLKSGKTEMTAFRVLNEMGSEYYSGELSDDTKDWILTMWSYAEMSIDDALDTMKRNEEEEPEDGWMSVCYDFADEQVPYQTFRRWFYWVDLQLYRDADPDGYGLEVGDDINTLPVPALFAFLRRLCEARIEWDLGAVY